MKLNKAEHDAETLRLADVRKRYREHLNQINQEIENGMRCLSVTDSEGYEAYYLVDKNKRISSGYFGCYEEAWLSFVG